MNLKLNLQGTKKIAAGLPWIGVKDLEHFKQPLPAGELIRLQDSVGNFLAHAVSEGPREPRVGRVLSRLRHPEFNQGYFEGMVENALRRRQALAQEQTGLRLIHGEADELPGVFCDRHGDTLMLDVQSPGMQGFMPWIEEALWKQSGAKALWIRRGRSWERIRGETRGATLRSRVSGMPYLVRFQQEAAGDFDLEQRMNYARLGELGLKGEALAVFSRRGAWAAAALRAGCEKVLCLERDTEANTMAMESLELNGFKGKVEIVQGDAMERLEKLKGQGRQFGFIMADMPRHSAGANLNFKASQHGAGLAARIFALLSPGGVAAFGLASPELNANSFQAALQRGVKESGLEMELIAAGRWAADFPELPGFEFEASRRFSALKRKGLPSTGA